MNDLQFDSNRKALLSHTHTHKIKDFEQKKKKAPNH